MVRLKIVSYELIQNGVLKRVYVSQRLLQIWFSSSIFHISVWTCCLSEIRASKYGAIKKVWQTIKGLVSSTKNGLSVYFFLRKKHFWQFYLDYPLFHLVKFVTPLLCENAFLCLRGCGRPMGLSNIFETLEISKKETLLKWIQYEIKYIQLVKIQCNWAPLASPTIRVDRLRKHVGIFLYIF